MRACSAKARRYSVSARSRSSRGKSTSEARASSRCLGRAGQRLRVVLWQTAQREGKRFSLAQPSFDVRAEAHGLADVAPCAHCQCAARSPAAETAERRNKRTLRAGFSLARFPLLLLYQSSSQPQINAAPVLHIAGRTPERRRACAPRASGICQRSRTNSHHTSLPPLPSLCMTTPGQTAGSMSGGAHRAKSARASALRLSSGARRAGRRRSRSGQGMAAVSSEDGRRMTGRPQARSRSRNAPRRRRSAVAISRGECRQRREGGKEGRRRTRASARSRGVYCIRLFCEGLAAVRTESRRARNALRHY